MPEIKFYNRPTVPMEMHKVKIVQKLTMLSARQRLEKLREAGFNSFMLHNGDIFMDMLTDSGVNAMSDNMQSAMLRADDAYAGSETFYRMQDKLEEIFGFKYLLIPSIIVPPIICHVQIYDGRSNPNIFCATE